MTDLVFLKRMLGKSEVQIKKETQHFGNEYGGFDVAVSLLCNVPCPIVYSFGIGEDLSFSYALLQFYPNAEIYAFDPTPKAIDYVRGGSGLSKEEHFHFYPWGISDKDEETEFYLPQNEGYVSGSVKMHSGLKKEGILVKVKRLETIMKKLGHSHIDILKMDIEGSEFEVITDILNSGIDFTQLCVETHQRFYEDGTIRWKRMKKELNRAGYRIVSESSSHQEFTFIR